MHTPTALGEGALTLALGGLVPRWLPVKPPSGADTAALVWKAMVREQLVPALVSETPEDFMDVVRAQVEPFLRRSIAITECLG